jgi:hypothetical protein
VTVVLPEPLKRFIWDFQSVVELAESPRELLLIGGDVFRRALGEPDLLPPVFTAVDPARPRLRQLFADALSRFVPACLVLAPGQGGPLLPGPGYRMAGVLSGAVLRQMEGDPREVRLAEGQMEIVRGGAAQYINCSMTEPALLLLTFDAANLASPIASGFTNDPLAPPFDIFTIQTRIEI